MALINGGFETGDLTGWTKVGWGGAGYNGNVNVASKHSGNYGLQTAAWSSTPGTKGIRFTQSVDLTGIDSVDFWYKIIDLDGGAESFEFRVSSVRLWVTSGPIGGWIHESVDVSGYSGNHNIDFMLVAEGAGPPTPLIELYLDDIELILTPNYTLSGKVSDEWGNPIRDVDITISNGTTYTTTTNENGDYSQVVNSDTYNIAVSKPRTMFHNITKSSIAVTADTTQDITMPIDKITGKQNVQKGISIIGGMSIGK